MIVGVVYDSIVFKTDDEVGRSSLKKVKSTLLDMV